MILYYIAKGSDSVDMDNKLDVTQMKKKKLKYYKIFDLFLRSVLTLFGSVSLVSILMFLNSRFGVSYFSCLIITFIAPSVYSAIVNSSLEDMDNKIKKMELEICELEDECKKENGLTKDSIIKNIEIRFEGLSNDRKRELLSYIKDRIPDGSCYEYISKLEDNDSLSLMDDEHLELVSEKEYVYSRKRNINDEIRK